MADKTPGQILHEARQAGGEQRPRPMPVEDWAERDDRLKQLDEAMAEAVAAEVRGRFGHALREHWLAGISWDHARDESAPVCACTEVSLGWHATTGAAVEAWIVHVMDVVSSEEGDGRG